MKDIRHMLKKRPRDARWLLANIGKDYLKMLHSMKGVMVVTERTSGRCWYYVQPKRVGKRWRAFFEKMGEGKALA